MSRRFALAVALVLCSSTVPACERSKGMVAGDPDLTGGRLVFEDDFERAELGTDWRASGTAWRLERGTVQVRDARNDALWLQVPLPDMVRVEFDVTAQHVDGDLKFEIFGDGQSHESGYIAIFGGWSNSTTCIARLDEHGADRLDAREHTRVRRDQTYRFAALRTDDRLRWFIDGALVLSFDDASPLRGEGHRHLGFNNWAVPASFDNLEVYDLSPK